MTTNAYTLQMWINQFRNQTNVVSDFITKWPISDGTRTIFYMENTLLSKYTWELDQHKTFVDLSEREQHFYAYNPRLFSYDLYGYPEFWYIILYANELHSATDFHPTRVKFYKSSVLNVLNEIRILEQTRKQTNDYAMNRIVTDNLAENADLLQAIL